jgi:hypothetical protein
MPTYTVHAPPAKKGDEPERFVFLRDGFHFWVFMLPPIWLLVYRQWLALLIYIVVMVLVVGGFAFLGFGAGAALAAAICIRLLVGFEAASIRRWTLRRRGWTARGFVVADDKEVAEQRFFARWAEREPVQATEPTAPALPPRVTPPSGREVIGLFPEPGCAR